MSKNENIIYFRKLAEQFISSRMLPIPYIGRGEGENGGRIHNPPAEHIEIIYTCKGSCKNLSIGNEKHELQPGKLTLHNVHFGNYSNFNPDILTWCVVFDITGIAKFKQLKKAPFFISTGINNPERIINAFKTATLRCKMSDQYIGKYFGGSVLFDPKTDKDSTLTRRLPIQAAVCELLWTFIDEINNNQNSQTHPIVQKAKEFITANYHRQHLSLEDIATAVNVSTNHIGLLFRTIEKTTPMRYLKQQRIFQATILMQRTSLKISEISEQVGFIDPLHFSREFKIATGQAPTDFQKNFRTF